MHIAHFVGDHSLYVVVAVCGYSGLARLLLMIRVRELDP